MVGQAYKLLIFDDGRCLAKVFLSKEYKYLVRWNIDLFLRVYWHVKIVAGMAGACLSVIIDFSRGVFTTSCCGVSNVAR
jgi:hypothetical protein